MLRKLKNHYTDLPSEQREIYLTRLVIISTLTIFGVLIFTRLSHSATAPITQQSLYSGAVSDRKAIAKLVFGGFGWTVIASASVIAVIDFFQKRDFTIFMNLAIGFLMFFILGQYFNH